MTKHEEYTDPVIRYGSQHDMELTKLEQDSDHISWFWFFCFGIIILFLSLKVML